MADAFNMADTAIHYADDGSPLIPTDRAQAAARLRALDADPAVADVLLDPQHPQHRDRINERKALQVIVSTARWPISSATSVRASPSTT
jgi:hypothetical protein